MGRLFAEMDADAIQVAVAGGVTLVTSLLVLRAGSAAPASTTEHPPSATREPASSAEPLAEAGRSTTPTSPGAVSRPRILTGEPIDPEQRKPAPHRAMKLVAGVTALALVGAFGLLAFVRALISLFDSIGG